MYAKLDEDGTLAQFPYTTEILRAENTSVSTPRIFTPANMAEWSVVPVQGAEAPVYDQTTQRPLVVGCEQHAPGKWRVVYAIVDRTDI